MIIVSGQYQYWTYRTASPTLDIAEGDEMTELLIAGGGIGGLTAALTLHARGIDSTVLERASHLRPLGVGINLLPHAVRELHELGLGDELSQVAVAPTSISYYDSDGKLLFREPRGIDGGYGYPQYSAHRGQLQMLLLSASRSPRPQCRSHGNGAAQLCRIRKP